MRGITNHHHVKHNTPPLSKGIEDRGTEARGAGYVRAVLGCKVWDTTPFQDLPASQPMTTAQEAPKARPQQEAQEQEGAGAHSYMHKLAKITPTSAQVLCLTDLLA